VRGWVGSAIGSDAQEASTSRQLAAMSLLGGYGRQRLGGKRAFLIGPEALIVRGIVS